MLSLLSLQRKESFCYNDDVDVMSPGEVFSDVKPEEPEAVSPSHWDATLL